MKHIWVFVILATFSNAQAISLYDEARNRFLAAKLVDISSLLSGWHSGRCWTQRRPEIEKSGLFVVEHKSVNGVDLVTQSIAASSIREPANFFDQLDSESYEEYKDLTYLDKNKPVDIKDESLFSHLFYDILIGDLYLREDTEGLWLTMTATDEDIHAPGSGVFYCRFSSIPLDLPEPSARSFQNFSFSMR